MYSDAFVRKINSDGTVTVGCSTKACQGCKCEMFCNNKDESEFTALNSKALDIRLGDHVSLFLPPARTIASTLLVFALPLVLFPAGYLLAKSLTSFNEILCALCGFAMMGISFSITAIINIRHRKALMPLIEKVL